MKKFSKKFDASSKAWLRRQERDPYVKAAKADGYRSRAAYKIIQLDEKFQFIKPGARIVDLGAAPGGWSQVLAQKMKGQNGVKGKIVATDILPMDEIPGVEFIHADFEENDTPDKIKESLGGKADVVLSDIAPNTTGHKSTDHIRIIALAELVWELAREILAEDGIFICKFFQGGAADELANDLKRHFQTVRYVKPDASRKDSKEAYIVATGFKTKNQA